MNPILKAIIIDPIRMVIIIALAAGLFGLVVASIVALETIEPTEAVECILF